MKNVYYCKILTLYLKKYTIIAFEGRFFSIDIHSFLIDLNFKL